MSSTASQPAIPGFELLAELQRDRLRAVYRARQVLYKREVTLTVVEQSAAGPGERAAFCREARAAVRLAHPGIVPILEASEADGQAYLATEPVPGESLQERLHRGPLAPAEAARLVEGLARAVAGAHAHGVCHLGLSPSGVVVGAGGAPRVLDFGLGAFLHGRGGRPFPGNPAYAAPEQLAGRDAGPASDVYALGAILYALLTDRPPVQAATPEETARLAASAEPVAPSRLQPGVPLDLEVICLRCLSKTPQRRFAGADAVADALHRFREGQPVLSPSRALATRLAGWSKRNRLAVALVGACLLLLGLAVAGAVVEYRAAARAGEEADRQRHLAETQAREALAQRDRAARAEARAGEGMKKAGRGLHKANLERDEALRQVAAAAKAQKQAQDERFQEGERRTAAEAKAREADDDRQQAVAARAVAARQLVRAHVAAGTRDLDGGEPLAALLWFAEALRLASQERLPEDVHRLRLAAVLADGPRPTQLWAHDKGDLNRVGLSPDGGRLFLAGADGELVLRDTTTGRRVGRGMRHGAPLTVATFSPDGKQLATAAATGAVRLWDVATEKEVFPALALDGPPVALAFSGDGRRLLTVSQAAMDPTQASAQVWNAASGEAIGMPLAAQVAPRPAALNRDGSRVLTCCTDRCARLWDPLTGNQVGADLSHGRAVVQALFSPDGRAVLTAGADATARLWDAVTGKPLTRPLRHGAAVERVGFRADGKVVLTAGADRAVRLWDAKGEPVGDPLRHESGLVEAAFSPDGRHLLTACEDGSVRVRDLPGGEALVPVLKHARPVRQAAFHPGGASVLTFDGGVARLWDLTAGEPLAPLPPDGPAAAAFSPDGKRLARVTGAAVQVHDAASGKPVGAALKHKQGVNLVAFSADGRRLLTVSHPAEAEGGKEVPTWYVRVWEAETGKPVAEPFEHLREVTAAAFSPDGSRVLTVCKDKRVRVWDAAKGGQVGKGREHDGDVSRAAFTPDGTHVLTCDAEGMTRVWETETGKRVGEGMGHAGPVTHLAFSADGKQVATASEDGTARVWEAVTGRPLTPPLPHDDAVLGAAFSPDGKKVATAGRDRSARVWDAGTGKPLTAPLAHREGVSLAAFSADGRWLVTAAGGRVRVWEAATGEPVTPSLRHTADPRAVTFVALGKDGRLVTASGLPGDPSTRWGRKLAADGRPAKDLVRLAEVLAGRKAEGVAAWGPFPARELGLAWDALEEKYPKEFPAPRGRLLAWRRRAAAECERRELWEGAVLHLGLLIEGAGTADLHARRARAHTRLRRWDRALADYTKALEKLPDRWDLWAGRADAAAGLGRWDQAVADYSKALEKEERRGELWARRARAEAERGKWDRAADDLAKAIRYGDGAPAVWHQEALARLAAGDKDGYRKLCARLVKRYGRGEEAAVARSVARTCALAEGALADLKPLLRQAERAVKAAPESAEDHKRWAVLLYRAGEHKAALERMQQALKLPGAEADVRDALLLALAHQRLGLADEAKAWLGKARPKEGAGPPPWHERLERRLWRQEAEALVKGAKP
jgi:WD40 repeat protein/tetratricopeptide (TPR) repeat protein